MKILQVGKFYPIKGGVEKVMYDLTVGLSQRGIDCDMLCADHDLKGVEVRLNEHGRIIACPAITKKAATMISPAMISKLRAICNDYDIIHVHHPDPMACLALFLSGYKGKVVLHWHSDILKQKFLLKLYRPLQNWLLKRADKIVGTTPVYLEQSPDLKNVQNKTVALPIGIEPVVPNPEQVTAIQSRYSGKKIIFSLGRLVEYKGFRYLVEAARYLSDEYVVLIGGDGPLKEDLLQRIREWKLQDKVQLLGRVSDEDLPNYYGACKLFCLSSIQKTEAFAIVQIEAMSCGKPVVATRIPESGVSWVNAHEDSGLNAEPCNAKQLAEAVEAITKDENIYQQYSARAKQRFDKVFTLQQSIDNVLKIYESL